VKLEASYLEKTIAINARKLLVKAHAQHLITAVGTEQKERM